MVRDAESSADKPTFSWVLRKPIPVQLGLIAGDCLQNARSSLDYLIWELVLAAKHHPGDRHMFPICTTGASFKKALKSGRLENIDPAAIAVVDTLQPYQAGEMDSPAVPLAVLDNLVNVNKHRRVLLTVVRSIPKDSMLTIRVAGDEWGVPTRAMMNPNAPEYGKRLTIEQMNSNAALVAFVALDEGPGKGVEVTILLDALLKFVADEVVAEFGKFF